MADALAAEYPDRITLEHDSVEPAPPLVHAGHRRSARRWTTGGTSIRAGITRRSCATAARRWRRRLRACCHGLPLLGSGPALQALRRPCAGPSIGCCRRRRKWWSCSGRIDPDVLLLTPLLYFRSHQVDHVRCARRAGIKSIVGIGSWDHLTTKGLLHEVPDRVLVWNEAQKQEAIELHGVPGGAGRRHRVAGLRPLVRHDAVGRPRGVLRPASGSTPARPILLYLCSSSFIAPYEVGLRAPLGGGDPRAAPTRGCATRACWSGRIRRTPSSGATSTWRPSSSSVAVWPKAGVNPIGGAARSDYFDSMYHADAVVGVNTSGMIESGIIGRPVYAVQVDGVRRHAGRHAALPAPEERGRRPAAPVVDARRARGAARAPAQRTARPAGRRRAASSRRFVRPHGLERGGDAARGRRRSSSFAAAAAARAGSARRPRRGCGAPGARARWRSC